MMANGWMGGRKKVQGLSGIGPEWWVVGAGFGCASHGRVCVCVCGPDACRGN